jgi:hypothetical protein
MRGHLRLTTREKIQIRAGIEQHKCAKQIAQAIGRYPASVVRFARREGLPLERGNRYPQWTHEEIRFLRRASADGWTAATVVKRLPGRSLQSVYRQAKQIGVRFTPGRTPCKVHFCMSPQAHNKLRLAASETGMKMNQFVRMVLVSTLRDSNLLAMICEPNAIIEGDAENGS